MIISFYFPILFIVSFLLISHHKISFSFIIDSNQIISSDNSKILFDFFVENILKGNVTQKQFQSAEYIKRAHSQGLVENSEVVQFDRKKTNETERMDRKRKITEDD